MLESMHLPPSRPSKIMQRLLYRARPKGRYFATNNTQGMHEQVIASAPALQHRMMQLSEGVDLSLFKPSEEPRPPGPVRLISVSRLSESHKDISTLIDAASLLRDRGIEFELTIVGDGEDKALLERRADDAGLIQTGTVRFIGWAEDVPGLLATSDIFVNSTHFESFGRTNIEAAACGLPVVASRVIGCVESVSDGDNGVLVEPANPNALANTLQELIEQPEKRRRLGEAGVRFAAGFSMLAHTRRIVEIANQRLGAGLSIAAR
jgi:glycosyltransferase involved in cell wall biosynthesis